MESMACKKGKKKKKILPESGTQWLFLSFLYVFNFGNDFPDKDMSDSHVNSEGPSIWKCTIS